MKSKPLRSGLCIYCDVRDATTLDELPPRNLFEKRVPRTLVKVPSCFECNNGASKDDEHFRLSLSLRWDMNHPDAIAARDSAIRSLHRPEAGGLRASFLGRTREVELITPAGLYFGRTGVYDVDVERLDRVMRRITLGFFYTETGQRLADRYDADSYLLPQVDPSARAQLQRVIDAVAAMPPKIIGRQTVIYRVAFAEEDRNLSAWLFDFYKRVRWLTITGPAR